MIHASIIDCGTINLGSMRDVHKKVGATSSIAGTAQEVLAASKIIPPGVGAFGAGMRVPHMGWNAIAPRKPSPLVADPLMSCGSISQTPIMWSAMIQATV